MGELRVMNRENWETQKRKRIPQFVYDLLKDDVAF